LNFFFLPRKPFRVKGKQKFPGTEGKLLEITAQEELAAIADKHDLPLPNNRQL
jgi:hypothetical protein